jgi:hypothetical protein
VGRTAACGSSAAWIGRSIRSGTACLLALASLGCAAGGPAFRAAPPPSAEERYCAWFGDEEGGILYFGVAPFWSAHDAAGGDPMADPAVRGPMAVGRFDLAGERFLEPFAIAPDGQRSGAWDVLAAGGRVYFTSLYDPAGSVEVATGRVARFAAGTQGLNELAAGPGGRILATRYFDPETRAGSVVWLDAEGAIEAEHPLVREPGIQPAAKSLAWDPVREEVWVNTDLFPEVGQDVGHDVRVLDRSGRELLRFADPEVQFMTFAPDGTGWLAERSGTVLALRHLSPGESRRPPEGGTRIVVDERFAEQLDFVQDVTLAPDGSALATRWGGRIHRVWPDGRSASQLLRDPGEGGLYYTGVVHRERVCATLCAGVSVVCDYLAPAAPGGSAPPAKR